MVPKQPFTNILKYASLATQLQFGLMTDSFCFPFPKLLSILLEKT